jgi:hypothetical protein
VVCVDLLGGKVNANDKKFNAKIRKTNAKIEKVNAMTRITQKDTDFNSQLSTVN